MSMAKQTPQFLMGGNGGIGYESAGEQVGLLSTHIDPDTGGTVYLSGMSATDIGNPNFGKSWGPARTLAANILADVQSLGARRKAVYCRTGATGAANGTSWRDAYTTLGTATAALTDDSILYLDSTEAAPFACMSAANNATLSRVEVVCDAGPNAGTWITGRVTGTWTDQGGGIFRTALAVAPYAVSWDFKRDSTSGAVTGIDLTQVDVAVALAEKGLSASDCVAWYGFLDKEAAGTTTPALGKWSHTGGYVYINPPGSPLLATVQAKAAWATAADGLSFNGTCVNWYIHGKLTIIHTPANAAASGYSIKFSNPTRIVVADVISILSGYHAICYAGGLGVGNVIMDCVCIGYVKGGIAITFYATNGLEDANARADNILVLAFGLLGTSGAPLELDHSVRSGYSHTGTGSLTGVTYSRITQIDFVGQQEAKHSVTLTAGSSGNSGFITAANVGTTYDLMDDATWGIKAYDCKALGKAAFFYPKVLWDGCTLDRLGYGANTQYVFSGTSVVDSSSNLAFLYRNCTFRFGDHDRFITNFNGGGNPDTMFLDGCDIFVTATGATSAFVAVAVESPACITMRNNRFSASAAGKSVFQITSTTWSTWNSNFTSLGGNTYSATMTTPAVISTGGSTKTRAEWLAGTDLAGLDIAL